MKSRITIFHKSKQTKFNFCKKELLIHMGNTDIYKFVGYDVIDKKTQYLEDWKYKLLPKNINQHNEIHWSKTITQWIITDAFPHLVMFYDYYADIDNIFLHLYYEYAQGITLSHWIRDKHTISELLQVLIQVYICVKYMNIRIGMSHGDIKARNIMIQSTHTPTEISYESISPGTSLKEITHHVIIVDYGNCQKVTNATSRIDLDDIKNLYKGIQVESIMHANDINDVTRAIQDNDNTRAIFAKMHKFSEYKTCELAMNFRLFVSPFTDARVQDFIEYLSTTGDMMRESIKKYLCVLEKLNQI